MTCIFEGNDDVSIVGPSSVDSVSCERLTLSDHVFIRNSHLCCALANMQKSAVARMQISFPHTFTLRGVLSVQIEFLNIWFKTKIKFYFVS